MTNRELIEESRQATADHVNPDGPDAAAEIERLAAELDATIKGHHKATQGYNVIVDSLNAKLNAAEDALCKIAAETANCRAWSGGGNAHKIARRALGGEP